MVGEGGNVVVACERHRFTSLLGPIPVVDAIIVTTPVGLADILHAVVEEILLASFQVLAHQVHELIVIFGFEHVQCQPEASVADGAVQVFC